MVIRGLKKRMSAKDKARARRKARRDFLIGKRVLVPLAGIGVVEARPVGDKPHEYTHVQVCMKTDLRGRPWGRRPRYAQRLNKLRLAQGVDPLNPTVMWRFEGGWYKPGLFDAIAPNGPPVSSLKLVYPVEVDLEPFLVKALERFSSPTGLAQSREEVECHNKFKAAIEAFKTRDINRQKTGTRQVVSMRKVIQYMLRWYARRFGCTQRKAEQRAYRNLTHHVVFALAPDVPRDAQERLNIERELRYDNPGLHRLYLAKWWYDHRSDPGTFDASGLCDAPPALEVSVQ